MQTNIYDVKNNIIYMFAIIYIVNTLHNNKNTNKLINIILIIFLTNQMWL